MKIHFTSKSKSKALWLDQSFRQENLEKLNSSNHFQKCQFIQWK